MSLAGNSGRLTWVRHSSRQSSATHSYQCVQYCRVSKQRYGCQCWGFATQRTTVVDACDCTRGLYGHRKRFCTKSKLQALVYDILPSTAAVFSYAVGSRKLSDNEQFFVGNQTVVSLLQTTQIKQGVSFIAANKVYTSANKTTIV